MTPLEFSDYGDDLFKQLVASLNHSRVWRLLIEQPIGQSHLASIRLAVATYISECLGSSCPILDEAELLSEVRARKDSAVNITPNGLVVPKRDFIMPFNAMQKSVAVFFSSLGINDLVESIHIPISLRIADGAVNEARDARPYATNKMHSDVWAGEPLDAVVVHIPLFGDAENVGVEFSEMDRGMDMQLMRVLPDYTAGTAEAGSLNAYDAVMKLGHAYFADARLLHGTLRRAPNLRISIDFRFRMRSAGLYREAAEKILAAGRMENYVTSGEFLKIGSETLMIFEESCEDARTRYKSATTQTRYATTQRLINLFDAPRG
jgi:hypothetical protein